MGLLDIKNGEFDNDQSAEKIRISFDKVKDMFAEFFEKIPLEFANGTEGFIIKVKADRTGFELVALDGGGDMLGSNNLSELTDESIARDNLGLGDLATQNSGDFATSDQGELADSAMQSLSVVPDKGLSLTEPTPNNFVLDFNGGNIYISNIQIDPATKVLTLAREGDTDLTIDLSPYLVLWIDGFQVTKGDGKTNMTTIEIGDKCRGWEEDTDVAFKVVALPHDTEVDGEFINRQYATQNSL